MSKEELTEEIKDVLSNSVAPFDIDDSMIILHYEDNQIGIIVKNVYDLILRKQEETRKEVIDAVYEMFAQIVLKEQVLPIEKVGFYKSLKELEEK